MVSIINFVIVQFNLTLYLLLCNLSRFDYLIRKQFDNLSYFNWTKGILDPYTRGYRTFNARKIFKRWHFRRANKIRFLNDCNLLLKKFFTMGAHQILNRLELRKIQICISCMKGTICISNVLLFDKQLLVNCCTLPKLVTKFRKLLQTIKYM